MASLVSSVGAKELYDVQIVCAGQSFGIGRFLGAASSASAGMQMSASAALLTGAAQVTPVTFWAQPYPYRYVPSRHCPLVR